MNKFTTIIIPSYRSKKLILTHINRFKNFKIIIVENSNDAAFKKIIENKYKNVDIYLKKNIGYGRAVNFASQKVKTKYFFVTNPDTKIYKNTLHNLVDAANKINKFYTNSKILHKWEYKFSQIGYNYKMPALNAQLGIAQLKKIDFFLKKKRKLYKRYLINFKKIKEINIFKEPKYCKSNYWLQTLVLKKPSITTRNLILNQYID